MRTKLSALAAAAAESCWLATLVVVPVFFNVHSYRTFEEDKIPFLRSLALVVVVALVIRTLEEGRQAWTIAGRPIWRLPLVMAALLLTAAYGISTLFSIAPLVSVWGSYERTQGTYTWLSYVAIFLAMVVLLRTRQQLERLVTVILLASVAPAIYAVVQHFGLDPIRWGMDVTIRAHGTTGNPIFLAAYLIMVAPLTLARAIMRWHAANRRAATAYLLLLTLQLLALMYAGSRGPLIGLAVGVAVLFLVTAIQRRHRRLITGVIGLTVAAASFVGVLNIEGGPLQSLRSMPPLDLLGRLFEAGSGTGKVRVVIWEGSVNLLAADPLRDVIGYGPEALFLAYTPFYPPELARYESRRVAPDRAHNETFDAFITTGLVGGVAELVLFVLLFAYLLHWLGLMTSVTEGRTFAALTTCGAAAGTLAPYLVDSSFRYSGLCLPLGIVAGLVVYLLVIAVTKRDPGVDAVPWRNLLLLALLGGLLGHFVEIQFGIAISSTRLLFWVYAALTIVVGLTLHAADTESGVALTAPSGTALESSGFDYGVTVGLILLILTFDLYRPELSFSRNAGPLLAVFLGTWLFGAVVVAADTAWRPLSQLVRYSATSLGVWLVFAAIYVPWLNWRPSLQPFHIEQVLPAGQHLANSISILYLSAFAVAAANATALLRREPQLPAAPLYRRGWHVGLSVLLLLACVPAIIRTNLDMSRADMFLKQIDFYTKQHRLDAALVVAEQARSLDASVDQYDTAAVRVLMDLARAHPEQRDSYLSRAQATMEEAQRRNPLNLDNTRNLARLHRLWAALAAAPAERKQHLDTAQGYYTEAARLSPNNASLWNEWALLYVELREPDKALPLLNHSLEIDDGYTTTWWLRANLHIETGALESALTDYDRALQIDPTLLAAWSGKALALARLNRLADAISANQESLKVAPNDLISHRNLALLYYQTGQPDLALHEAQVALQVAQSPKDKADLVKFIRQVQVGPAAE
jgi:tetratricopeptide (TPR) repeat protein/O-antigen ligase